MEITSDVMMKPFSQCVPGELIRAQWGSRFVLALVTKRDTLRALVVLRSDREESLPRYAYVDADEIDGAALSYGKTVLEVDHDGPVGIGSTAGTWEKAGTIALMGTSWLIFAPPFPPHEYRQIEGLRPAPAYWDLRTGAFTPGLSNNKAATTFGRWAIYPKRPDGTTDRSAVLFSFRHEPPSPG